MYGGVETTPQLKSSKDSYVNVIQSGNTIKRIDEKTSLPKMSPTLQEDMVTVTLSTSPAPEGYMVDAVFVYNDDFSKISYSMSDYSDGTVSVEPGTYDFCCRYINFFTYNSIYDVKEKVQVNENCNIVFDPSEATNKISFSPKLKNGENMSLTEYSMWTGEMLQEGNMTSISYAFSLYCENGGEITGNTIYAEGGYSNLAELMSIEINDVSDRYGFIFNCLGIGNDNEIYVLKKETEGCGEDITLSNDPESFITFSKEIDIEIPDNYSNELYTTIEVSTFVNGEDPNGWTGGSVNAVKSSNETTWINLDAPLENKGEKWNMQILVSPGVAYMIKDEEKKTQKLYGVSSPSIGFEKGEMKEFYVENGIYHDTWSYNFPENGFLKMLPWFPGIDEFNFEPGQTILKAGESVPFNIFKVQKFDVGDDIKYFGWEIENRGILSETRSVDDINTKIELKYGDEPVDIQNMDELLRYPYNLYKSGNTDYKNIEIELSVLNEVSNTSNITNIISDLTKDDYIPPTLRMLQFRNSEGIITNRFSSNTSVSLRLTAGDFNYNLWDFECYPVDVVCEWSQAGQDDWQPIIMQIDEMESSSNFGYFYEGDFSVSSPGFYDIKISLTDESGNSQCQILGNALFVDTDEAGVDHVLVIDNTDAVYYNLQGVRVDNPQGGIYVKVVNGKATKVLVK